MNLVNEQDGVVVILHGLDHRFQTFLEIAAIARAGQQLAHIKRIDHGAGQHRRHLAIMNTQRQTLGNGRLANTRVADIERVVLGPAAQYLHRPVNFAVAADQRINTAGSGLGDQVNRILAERIGALGALGFGGLAFLGRTAARILGAMANIGNGIKARHVQRLEEPDSMGFSFRENGDQHIGPGGDLAPG